jgi:hypothetical protein
MVVDGQISFLPLFCSSDNISDKSIILFAFIRDFSLA